jgi:6-phosphogluconolactonase
MTSRNVDRTPIQLLVLALCCSLCVGTAWADGAVYAMTNALVNNQVLVYHRASNGSLSAAPIQTISTGGGGSGLQLSGVDSLGSAGSVQLDEAHQILFVVNTESVSANSGAGTYNEDCALGTITSFLVASDGTLTFADRVYSGGLFPNSLTVKSAQIGDLLWVLNAGGPGICAIMPNITGFSVNAAGQMSFIRSQKQIDPGPASAATGVSCLAASAVTFLDLTGAPAADFACGLNPPSFARSPAQVRFNPDGNQLAVTVKGTNTIYVFPLDANGMAGNPTITQATGPALPSFAGFTFTYKTQPINTLLVAELFGRATSIPAGGKGAVSSFLVSEAGSLEPIGGDVGDAGTAAISIAVEPTAGHYAYVANNLSASISSYAVGRQNSVTLVAADAAAVSGPNDLATAEEGGASFLYVVEGGSGAVGAFQINLTDGSLSPFTAASGLPSTAQGLAAY